MIVPLVAQARALGAITFVAAESRRTYGEADLVVALDLARRAATAVDNAILYREALLKESQVRFLAEAGSVLSEQLDYDATLDGARAARRAADRGLVHRRRRRRRRDPARRRRGRRRGQAARARGAARALSADVGLAAAGGAGAARGRAGDLRGVRRRAPRRHRSSTSDHLRIMQHLDPHSAVAMPLVARGEKVGAITFAWSQTRRYYSERDLPLMDDLATRAALAVDNARLYARERATGDQLAFLAEMSSVLASSLDYETTLANVAQLIVPQFADWCAVDVVAEDGSIKRLAVVHRDPEKEQWARPLARLPPAGPGRARGLGARRPDRRAGALPAHHRRVPRSRRRAGRRTSGCCASSAWRRRWSCR